MNAKSGIFNMEALNKFDRVKINEIILENQKILYYYGLLLQFNHFLGESINQFYLTVW